MDIFTLFAGITFPTIAWHPWKVVGLVGACIFGSRFIIQWIASERAGKSVIPFGFWEASAIGNVLTLSYFIFYQKDSVGIILNLFPLPIYLRNLYFTYRKTKPKHPGNEPRPADNTESE